MKLYNTPYICLSHSSESWWNGWSVDLMCTLAGAALLHVSLALSLGSTGQLAMMMAKQEDKKKDARLLCSRLRMDTSATSHSLFILLAKASHMAKVKGQRNILLTFSGKNCKVRKQRMQVQGGMILLGLVDQHFL